MSGSVQFEKNMVRFGYYSYLLLCNCDGVVNLQYSKHYSAPAMLNELWIADYDTVVNQL